MKEQEFITIIKNSLQSDLIGDDCAYLKDLGIVISQDNLTEDIHFSTKYIDAYTLGYKAAAVNISDIAASGAKPEYITVGLSLPKNTDAEFIKEFYNGLKDACGEIKIVGGDITGSDKIFISIAIIGTTKNRKISSRSNAKPGYKIIVSGKHGSSSAGLKELFNGKQNKFTQIHLMPKAQLDFSKNISEKIKEDYAMMDTSDGLADALIKIANASNVSMEIDFNKIPYDKDIEKFKDYKDLILFGGEDYQLVACVPLEFEVKNSFEIGYVKEGQGVKINGKQLIDLKLFNHF